MKISVVRNILEANDRIAQQNRDLFTENGLLVINLMSSPGAGKTSLLEKTIDALKDDVGIGIIEGDIQSTQDAERIARKGVPAVQINTGGECHLDGNMIRDAFKEFDFEKMDLLIVENVGNLVCPAEFDIGEDARAVVLSVTEGEDKPAKYPLMFRECEVALLNKVDLLPYLDYDKDKAIDYIHQVHPDMPIFEISAKTEEGFEPWLEWLVGKVRQKKQLNS